MRVEINLEKLVWGVNRAVSCVMKTGSNQQLKGIYFEARDGSVLLRSTNIDIGFETEIDCKVETSGKFLILGDTISRLLSSLNSKKGEVLELALEGSILNMKLGKHNFSLKTLQLDNFPSLPSVSGVDFEISNKVFINGLKQSSYAVAKSEIKPEISGVYIKQEDGNLCFVATDAYRLVEKKQEVEGLPDFGIIVPDKNIRELFKLFDVDTEDNISVTVSKNSLSLRQNKSTVVTRLIEGNFPNYTQIIPSSPVSFAVFLKEDLVRSLKLSGFFADKTSQITLSVNENEATIDAANQEIGLTKEVVPTTLKGEGFSVKMNLNYLLEFLGNITDSSVVMKFTAQNKAIIVQGIQDANYTYLLMPSYR